MLTSFKKAFWVVVPVVLLTSIRCTKSTQPELFSAQEHGLRATGHLNEKFKGTMHFETTSEKLGNGNSFAVLRLMMHNESANPEYAMEFMISDQNDLSAISAGTYGIAKDDYGLLNYVDGLFGFANIKGLGELPFFVHNGQITIIQSDSDRVKGSMHVTMENNNGQKFQLSGDFIASHN